MRRKMTLWVCPTSGVHLRNLVCLELVNWWLGGPAKLVDNINFVKLFNSARKSIKNGALTFSAPWTGNFLNLSKFLGIFCASRHLLTAPPRTSIQWLPCLSSRCPAVDISQSVFSQWWNGNGFWKFLTFTIIGFWWYQPLATMVFRWFPIFSCPDESLTA